MAWVQEPNGRWVKKDVGVRPPAVGGRSRSDAVSLPSVPQQERAHSYTPLNAQFLKNPITFMRKFSVSPPDNSGIADFAHVAAALTRPVSTQDHAEGGTMKSVRAGGVRFVRFAPHISSAFPNALWFNFDPDGAKGAIPIHWLPWQSRHMFDLEIPASPSGLEDPDDPDYPGVFFTAGINGCSVFIQGSPSSPKITHAGIDGTLKTRADAFWKSQMSAFGLTGPTNPIRGEANTFDYMKGIEFDTKIKNYKDWLSSNSHRGTFELKVTSPFGCVFGFRFGRSWTFYLQRNVVVEHITFHKEGDVNDTTIVGKDGVRGQERFELKSESGVAATLHQQTSESVRRKIGGFNLPVLRKEKITKTFAVVRKTSIPMGVGEIYPRMLVDTALHKSYS